MRANSPNRSLLGVLLLLLAVVLAPTAGLVWFMTAAMQNERAAVRETLTAAYEVRLAGQVQQLEALWESRRARLEAVSPDDAPSEVFAALVRDGVADSAIVYDEAGRLRYPGETVLRPPRAAAESAAWAEAQRLEFGAGRPAAAARAYGTIAERAQNVDLAARALQARARCLAKAGERDEAVAVLTSTLTADRYRGARDGQGRLVAPDSLLLALHLLADPSGEAAQRTAAQLSTRLADYGEPRMPQAQRRFLMRQLQELVPDAPPVDTFAAEELAERYAASEPRVPMDRGLAPSVLPGVWQLASNDGRVVALYEDATVRASVAGLAAAGSAADEIELELLPPASESPRAPFLTRATGAVLPGWTLALHLADEARIDQAAEEEIAGYLWTGALLIGAVLIFALLVARSVSKQVRVAKLKNDLIATVTHELKTPLASMRLLVDTLLDGKAHDATQVREYLELIAKENERLSRLIEDFLAFSRMERNKQAFEKRRIAPAAVAGAAAEAVGARFDNGDCRFEVEIDDGLPDIVGDAEALSTVLVNLLDNAYKYTEDEKWIRLRTFSENGEVVFSVQDNGVGLSRRAAKRVFDRFYQVDDSLARSGSGVGLGLAIVKFIVDAHGGEVSVASEPGNGSTFRVSVPAASGAAAH